MNRLRSALKPGQDFCQASCQKTCPYGNKESDSCLSTSVPLTLHSIRTPILFPSTISPPSARIYKGKAVWRLESSSPENLGDSAILPTAKISTSLIEILSSRSHKTPAVYAPGPTGENDDREQAVARLSHSADRPKHNIIGP